MSPDPFNNNGSSAGEGSSRFVGDRDFPSQAPDYVVMGSGSMSENASSLMESLNNDSGYGGSISDGFSSGFYDSLMQDGPLPSRFGGLADDHSNRQTMANHLHQLHYNANRSDLSRTITRTVSLLNELQAMNRRWPVYYPSQPHGSLRSEHDGPQHLPQLSRSNSTHSGDFNVESRLHRGPRLVTPQIEQDLSVLKLDLKLGAVAHSELVHTLEKNSIASLLDSRVSQSVRHLLSLRDRIEDTASKVLITGDLNAGKSTFCNALLRRKILPEDQQPCTSVFCEVVDARENGGIEEVHAIHKDANYDRYDESTYDVYSLQNLEQLVIDNTKYTQCKVYVKDIRKIDQSLLNNGVVDISIIDAPGLNSDSVKTTAVFARQEEIDVVVFVVSAANHFTLSAQEFISNAAHEKAYIFIVVNGYDNIRDKERCQQMVLRQVARLSPRTFKESAELVHFVSSNAIPVAPPGASSISASEGSGDRGDGGGDEPGDDDDDAKGKDKGKGKGKGKANEDDKEKMRDFEDLEVALRRFVLEKRSHSKLAPARTYLLNVLSDMNVLASTNNDVASIELERAEQEISDINPAYEKTSKLRGRIEEELGTSIDKTCDEVYDYTRIHLSQTIAGLGSATFGLEYPGPLAAFQYAEDLKYAMLDAVATSVSECEDHGRAAAIQGVNTIHTLGLLHVGADKYAPRAFRADKMFAQRRHTMARAVEVEVDFWDFFDIAGLWQRQEKVTGASTAVVVMTTLGGRVATNMGWMDGAFGAARVLGSHNLRRLIIPGLAGAALLAIGYAISQIPKSLGPNIQRKIATILTTSDPTSFSPSTDYPHSHATRISGEVRRILRMPSNHLQAALQGTVEDLAARKERIGGVARESSGARRYFGKLLRESAEARAAVERIDLDRAVTVQGVQAQPGVEGTMATL